MALKWRGDQVAKQIEQACETAARRSAEHLKERAVQRTPVETGALRNSAKVTTDKNVAAVAYGFGETADYAVKQHEEVGYAHTDGEAKFLENAMRAERGNIQNIIAEEVRKAL